MRSSMSSLTPSGGLLAWRPASESSRCSDDPVEELIEWGKQYADCRVVSVRSAGCPAEQSVKRQILDHLSRRHSLHRHRPHPPCDSHRLPHHCVMAAIAYVIRLDPQSSGPLRWSDRLSRKSKP